MMTLSSRPRSPYSQRTSQTSAGDVTLPFVHAGTNRVSCDLPARGLRERLYGARPNIARGPELQDEPGRDPGLRVLRKLVGGRVRPWLGGIEVPAAAE